MKNARSLAGYKLSPSSQLMLPWHPGKTISTTRAAELLGCSNNTILRMIEERTLDAFKMRKDRKNSHYRVLYQSVIRAAEGFRVQIDE